MKVLFLSDTHLGFARKHRDYPERREDAFRGFKNAVLIGIKEGADVFLHGGDMFDSVRPSFETLSEAVEILTSLPEVEGLRVTVYDLSGRELYSFKPPRVPFVAVHGNHDWNQNRENNIYTLLERAGLLIYAHRRIVRIEKDGEEVCVVGMGWIPDKYSERVISSYPLAPCETSYFLFHQPVKGLYPSNPREKLIAPSLFPDGYRLYLGGHLHWIVDKRVGEKRFLIPGSTVITSLKEGEMDRPRIVYLIEGASVRALEIPGVRRAFLVTASDFEDAVRSIEKVLEQSFEVPPIIKLVLEGKKEGSFDVEAIRGLFRGRALIYVFDRRTDAFFERIREIKREGSWDYFSRSAVVSILKEKMGSEWEDWMEELIAALLDGDEDRAEGILEGAPLGFPGEQKDTPERKSILDWV